MLCYQICILPDLAAKIPYDNSFQEDDNVDNLSIS